ncbi:hypothetical protein E3N88_38880 [Mikania micrantha]|uniref:ARID domain-containing protein n=1 Tax=Mikania micrantha TaxID=192012 RepID=A0A5N6LV74_9ASTR|nr:hypothetical protein E3N88_38880 [Mikania micrantha]
MKNNPNHSILGKPLYSGIRARKRKGIGTGDQNFWRNKNKQHIDYHRGCSQRAAMKIVKKSLDIKRGCAQVPHIPVVARNFKGFKRYEVVFDGDMCYVTKMFEGENTCGIDDYVDGEGAENKYLTDNVGEMNEEMSNETEKGKLETFLEGLCDNTCEFVNTHNHEDLVFTYVNDESVGNEVESVFIPIEVNSFEDCFFFIDMLETPNYIIKYKEKLKKQFQELIIWFFKNIGQPDGKPYPPMLPNCMTVDLLDLYLFVKSTGGYEKITNEKWSQIAQYLGFSDEFGANLKPIYTGYLELLLFFYNRNKKDGKSQVAFGEQSKGTINELDNAIMEEDIMPTDLKENKTDVVLDDVVLHGETQEKEDTMDDKEDSVGDLDDYFEDFIVIEDKEPPNED